MIWIANSDLIQLMIESDKMTAQRDSLSGMPDTARNDILFIQQMLGELRNVAKANDADMLVFLIEMAFAEAEDILSGKSPLTLHRI
jgi:hypothetical protein